MAYEVIWVLLQLCEFENSQLRKFTVKKINTFLTKDTTDQVKK